MNQRTTLLSQEEFIPILKQSSDLNGEIRNDIHFLNGTLAKCDSDVPWKTMSYSRNPIGLQMEILDFFQFFGPKQLDEIIRANIVERVAASIKHRFPESMIDTFGSYQTGLFLPYSDIDVVIYGDWSVNPLSEVVTAIEEDKLCDDEGVLCLHRAAIPVIKFRDRLTHTPVDICFNIYNADKNIKLVNNYLSTYPNISPLFLVLKEVLCERGLNEVYTGGLPSYALFLMIVSFFQLHPRSDACSANANVGVLLIEFLELYGCNFNFELTGIRITGGGSYVVKKDITLVNGDVPSALYIEDPLVEGSDVAKNSFNVLAIQKTFAHCYYTLDGLMRNIAKGDMKAENFSFLRYIIQIPNSFMQARLLYNQLHETVDFTRIPAYRPAMVYRPSIYSSLVSAYHGRGNYTQNIHSPINYQIFNELSASAGIPDVMEPLTDNLIPCNATHYESILTRPISDSKENCRDRNITQQQQLSRRHYNPSGKSAAMPVTIEAGRFSRSH